MNILYCAGYRLDDRTLERDLDRSRGLVYAAAAGYTHVALVAPSFRQVRNALKHPAIETALRIIETDGLGLIWCRNAYQHHDQEDRRYWRGKPRELQDGWWRGAAFWTETMRVLESEVAAISALYGIEDLADGIDAEPYGAAWKDQDGGREPREYLEPKPLGQAVELAARYWGQADWGWPVCSTAQDQQSPLAYPWAMRALFRRSVAYTTYRNATLEKTVPRPLWAGGGRYVPDCWGFWDYGTVQTTAEPGLDDLERLRLIRRLLDQDTSLSGDLFVGHSVGVPSSHKGRQFADRVRQVRDRAILRRS